MRRPRARRERRRRREIDDDAATSRRDALRANACAHRKVPFRLTSSTRSHSPRSSRGGVVRIDTGVVDEHGRYAERRRDLVEYAIDVAGGRDVEEETRPRLPPPSTCPRQRSAPAGQSTSASATGSPCATSVWAMARPRPMRRPRHDCNRLSAMPCSCDLHAPWCPRRHARCFRHALLHARGAHLAVDEILLNGPTRAAAADRRIHHRRPSR